MTEELKPCPFCASIDVEVTLEEEYWTYYSVSCNGCGACGPSHDDRIPEWVIEENEKIGIYESNPLTREEYIQQAIDRWNQRRFVLRGELVELV